MLSKIKDALSKRQLSGWQVRETKTISHQSFLALGKRECARRVETLHYTVSLHQRRTDPAGREVLGMSAFRVGAPDLERLENRIDEALQAAALVANQPFELPGPATSLPEVALADPAIGERTLLECEERLRAAVAREKGIRLSSAEFFADHLETRLINHRGLDVSQEETLLETEFILLAAAGSKENEFISRYTRRFVADFDLDAETRASARFARDATTATLPRTGQYPVLLSEEPLDHLFNPILARVSARLKYNKMIETDVGRSVIAGGEPSGDTITLWSNAVLDRAVGSSRFDSYGTAAGRTRLIHNNRVERLLADKRYADYLQVPATGELGNIEVEGGKVSFESLADPRNAEGGVLYHLQAFSAFEPNPITGAYSAEIRAGYEISTAGVRPIKGGSVSGVLQKDLLNCQLSKERAQREQALVPQGVRFAKLTIAGD